MAFLSVIVPVYGVEDYLPRCLDSLLADPALDVEVIAVDDASPDRSGAILDDRAASDPRLRVVHLEENGGLGAARNEGLARATGTYLWCVDSDDWVDAGRLAALVRRLDRERPEVMIVGYQRVHDGGPAGYEPLAARIGDTPPRFSGRDVPAVVQLAPFAWNKIVGRTFWRGLALSYPSGLYEDLPVTFPMLSAAEHIATFDEALYAYRQRPGSILHSSGAAHVDLVAQYELVLDRVEGLGPPGGPMVGHVYDYAVRHLFLMLGSDRLGRSERRRFFGASSELVRRRRPPHHPSPPGLDGLRDRLLVRGSWPTAVALTGLYRTGKSLRRRVASLVRS